MTKCSFLTCVKPKNHPRMRGVQSNIATVLSMLVLIALITRWHDGFILTDSIKRTFHLQESTRIMYSEDFNCSLKCSEIPAMRTNINSRSTGACPEYFRWIHEDLWPWKETGITREMLERSKKLAHMRIIIVNGRLYVEKYEEAYQTRDVVTIWGILQLLRLYPGLIPNVDLMFNCNDGTMVRRKDYRTGQNGSLSASAPPPLFHYCGDKDSYDIVFPDWSFWGWPEINIKPWEELQQELKEANARIKWRDREPYAYWNGNTGPGSRSNLVKCNITEKHDWKARIFNMNWKKEKRGGFRNSDLASQCTYRYKIYMEGNSWSVSHKYILSCDSMTLSIEPHFYDFFTRSLVPTVHYWPINSDNMCNSIQFAVDWGNNHSDKAQEIGKAGSKFIEENLVMKYVYDYIFHLLNEYAKLLRYKPRVPPGAKETCSETLICSSGGQKKKFRKHSMAKSPSDSPPCELPSPYERQVLRDFVERRESMMKEVISLEESKRS